MEQNSLKDIDTIAIYLRYKNENIMGKGIIYVTLIFISSFFNKQNTPSSEKNMHDFKIFRRVLFDWFIMKSENNIFVV